jgi:hypothetical protein
VWFFVKDEAYVLSIPTTLNNVKDRIRIAVGHSEHPFIARAGIWYVVECRLDVCMPTMATNGAHSKLAQGMTDKKQLLASYLKQYDFNICVVSSNC